MFKQILSVALLLIFALLFVLVFYSKDQSKENSAHVDQVVHVNCPLASQACNINLNENVKFEVSLSPSGFPALEPLVLQLKSSLINFKEINNFSAFFEGRDMEMGKHTLALNTPVEISSLIAKGVIPLCPMDPNMVWRLVIQFEFQNKVTSLEFELPSSTH